MMLFGVGIDERDKSVFERRFIVTAAVLLELVQRVVIGANELIRHKFNWQRKKFENRKVCVRKIIEKPDFCKQFESRQEL